LYIIYTTRDHSYIMTVHDKFLSCSRRTICILYVLCILMNALLCIQTKLGFYSKASTSYNTSIELRSFQKLAVVIRVVMVAGLIWEGGRGSYTPKPDTPNNNYSKCQRQNPDVNHGVHRISWKPAERQCPWN